MKRYSNDREIRKLQEEYENSQKENRYPKFGAEDFADLAQYYYENGEPDTAKEVADTAQSVYPHSDPVTLFFVRYAILEENDMEKAGELLESIADKSSDDFVFDKAEWLVYGKRAEEASGLLADHINLVWGDTEVANYVEDACRLFLNFNYADIARTWLQRMPDKKSERYILLLAEVKRVAGDWEGCSNVLGKLVEKNPFSSAGWVELSKIQYDLGRKEESAESYGYALAIDPDNLDALLVKGDILVAAGKYVEAEECYNRYLDAYPASPAVLNQLAYTLFCESEDNLPKSLELLQKAKRYVNHIHEKSIYADILQTEATTLAGLGKFDEAMADVEELGKLKVWKDDDVEFVRAHIYVQSGKPLEGCLVYDMILRRSHWPIDMMVRMAPSFYMGNFFEIGNYEVSQTLAVHPESEYTAELLAVKAVFAKKCKNEAEYEEFRDRAMEKDENKAISILKILEEEE